ncbi:MAG: hypothetical protein JW881_03210 [Spirochaetales bacterium]|nr:hypothetical protein [Spirochaetales bacterium]
MENSKIDGLHTFHYGLIAILGITFCFFIAFPFENHNESYFWVVILGKTNFIQAITENIFYQPNFRPLNNLIVYLCYKITGGGIYLHQLYNFLLAIIAWFFIAMVVKEKKIFALSSLLITGVFFTGYIYLFHLHGINYSPVLLLIACLYYLFENPKRSHVRTIVYAFIFTCIAYMAHPSSLLVFIGFLVGFGIENYKSFTFKEYILSIVFLIIAALLIILIRVSTSVSSLSLNLYGLLVSYRMIEIHPVISVFSLLLTIATIFSVKRSTLPIKIVSGIFFLLLSIVFFIFKVPVIFLWIGVSVIKMFLIKKWSLLFLILLTFPLPMGLSTGSPTYTIYTIAAATIAFPYGWKTVDDKIKFINQYSTILLYIVCGILIILLRMGISIPLVSNFTNPLLAEKEKTHQLKSITEWVIQSDYKTYDIIFYQEMKDPINNPETAIDRRNRPPTRQEYLDMYMEWLCDTSHIVREADMENKFFITFGNEYIDDMYLIKRFHGKFAGDALVYCKQNLLSDI